jgi:hypothetical protein
MWGDTFNKTMNYIAQAVLNANKLPQTPADSSTIQSALNLFYVIIGAVAFLLIIIAALRYVLSGGEANRVAEARRMIAYTLVGLAVIALAATIVNYVLAQR